MNLQSEEYAENKSFCEDLTEGKFSFPIIHAIRQNPSDHRLVNILKQRTTQNATKMYAVSYMEQVKKKKKRDRPRIEHSRILGRLFQVHSRCDCSVAS